MPKRIGFQKGQSRRRTYIKKWREYRGLTQEDLADQLETSHASISRIESGQQVYTQDFLEACADALDTDPASLLMREPTDHEAVWTLWDKAQPFERELIVKIATAILGEPHPKEDWLTEFLRDRSADEVERMKKMLEAAFPLNSKGG
jgi:transcriptional regulator with XRE-family HTH domain